MTYSALHDLAPDLSELLKPSERITVAEASEKYRYVNQPGAYVGPWYNSTTPYMVDPMNILADRKYNACIFAGPAQTGKTDALLLNWHTYSVICDPADMIIYQTSQSMARDFSKRRVDRLHRDSKEVGERLLQRRDADNTHDKFYRSGNMLTLSWPTINELSGRPVGRVAFTDYDRMPENIDKEGSAFDLGRKRTTTFGSFAMTLAESSPGYEVENTKWRASTLHEAPPTPGILALYNRGDRRRWYWPCPDCKEYYMPTFDLLWYPSEGGDMKRAEQAKMNCPHCGSQMSHDMKATVNQSGLWVADGQSVTKEGVLVGDKTASDIASFWLNGTAAAFSSWKVLVLNYIKAEREFENTGSQEALKSTVNTDQGEAYFSRGGESNRLPEDLMDRQADLGEKVVPAGALCLFATIDVQKNRFVVQVQGIGEGCDIFVVDRFDIVKSNRVDEDGERFWVNPGAYPEDWDRIGEEVISKMYPLDDSSGRSMQIKITACDSGGRQGVTANAYRYYRKIKKSGMGERFLLVKGDSRKDGPRVQRRFPDSERKDRFASARGEVPVLFINTDAVKDQLNAALERDIFGEGFIHFPDWLDEEFFLELCAETRTIKGWENPRKLRNESWDLLVYCIALIIHLKVEKTTWSSPPVWLRGWDENPLVRGETQGRLDVSQRKGTSTLKDLANRLA